MAVVHKDTKFLISFQFEPKVEVIGTRYGNYKVEFIDKDTNQSVHQCELTNNMWAKCNRRYYTPWIIKINGKVEHEFDLKGKKVYVKFESKSTGDTLAWIPQVVEFQKHHQCEVTVSTFHNEWFENLPEYQNLKFVKPGSSLEGYYACYQLGWFRNEKQQWDEGNYHPTQPNTIPLIQAASDILGIPYKEINYGIDFTPSEQSPFPDKYIVIAPRSTAGMKEWPHHYWEQLAKDLTDLGYKVVSVSKEGFTCPNVIDRGGREWKWTWNFLHHAELFIGLGSGVSWANWALNKYTLMINNFVPYGHDFTQNMLKVENHSVCNNCWADTRFTFDRGNWDWCPRHQGTTAQHICHKEIKPEYVLDKVKYILKHKLSKI